MIWGNVIVHILQVDPYRFLTVSNKKSLRKNEPDKRGYLAHKRKTARLKPAPFAHSDNYRDRAVLMARHRRF